MTSPHRYASSLHREDSDSSSSASRIPSYRLHQYGQRYIPQQQHASASSRAAAAQAAAAGSHFYTHPSRISLLDPFHHLLRPGEDAASPGDDTLAAMDNEGSWMHDGAAPSWPSARGYGRMSRKFDNVLPESVGDDVFFVPSYLRNSTHVARLKERHAEDAARKRADSGPDLTGGVFAEEPSAGSYRGLSHTVRERVRDDGVSRLSFLPSRWNRNDSYGDVEISPDGLSLKLCGPKRVMEKDLEFSSVRSNNPIPAELGIYYYEVTIINCRPGDTTIAVGFSSSLSALSRPVGWEPESWGYHGDDGQFITAHHQGKQFAQTFGKGDVIGVHMNFRRDAVFFTKNGSRLTSDDAFHGIGLSRLRLYPHVSMKKPGEEVRVNFGQSPFVYDIDDDMREERDAVFEKVNATDPTPLEPSMTETDMIQSLVLQYLRHDGYVETAKAFADDLREQQGALQTHGVDISGADDEDANRRQRIRRAVLEGEIDGAFVLINTHYPDVLEDYETVHFKLKCRRFIEIVRRVAILAMESSEGDMDMEVDHDDDHGSTRKALEDKALAYGRELQSEFRASATRLEQLSEIFTLLGYQNPLKEPGVAHLLSKHGRIALAEELNSAILRKSSRAALERVYAQTSVLLDMMRKEGDDAAFVSVKEVVDMVPRAEE